MTNPRLGVAVMLLAGLMVAGCSREPDALQIPAGTDVTLEKKDGVAVTGRLIEVQPQEVVLELRDGQRQRVKRAEIAALRATQLAAPGAATASASANAATVRAPQPVESPAVRGDSRAPAPSAASSGRGIPTYREVVIPAGTTLPVELKTAVASDTSQVEDPVRGTLRRPVTIDGVEAIPAGTPVLGHVTEADRSGRVKGRARVAFRFTQLDLPGDEGRLDIRTGTIAREAAATKKKDAAKIGGAAAGGAIIGGIIGGGDGAAKGAAIGGAAGTGVVLSTRGEEVRLPSGTSLVVKLAQALTVRVPVQ
jgi:hypothetical protein